MSRVGAVLPVRNDGKRLRAAVTSILRQTWTDWKLVIVDDSSDLPVAAEIPELADHARIMLIRNDRAEGISYSLNLGIAALDCEFLARMDSDDFSHPDRFSRQLDRLIRQPEVLGLGTHAHVLHEGPHGHVRGDALQGPKTPGGVRARLMWGNPMVHSSVMMRRTAVEAVGGYRQSDQAGFPEDLDLWTRLVEVGDLANLNAALHVYRRRPESVTALTGQEMGHQTHQVLLRYWDDLLAGVSGQLRTDVDGLLHLLVHAQIAPHTPTMATSVGLLTRAFHQATRGSSNPESQRELARMLLRVARLKVKARRASPAC